MPTTLLDRLPPTRGKLIPDALLAPFTWFRVGGPADALFLPADEDDLARFLAAAPADLAVSVLGVGSNVIIRDAGLEGVVVKLVGPAWSQARVVDEGMIDAGAGALDARVADAAASAGIAGLEFLTGVPGTIGGALKMNAGCYGTEVKDVLVQARGLDRQGRPVAFDLAACGFSYRRSSFPEGVILTGCTLRGSGRDDPDAIRARMADLHARREASQPIREKTGGSTFANPDPPGTPDQRRAWVLIDEAGLRGARRGGAQVSEKHCNFLINTGEATAADLEGLGEAVRLEVLARTGVDLRWEIKRLGRSSD